MLQLLELNCNALKKIVYFIILLCLCFHVKSSEPDSLFAIWKDKTRHDTARAMAMHIYSRKLVFNDPDSALHLSVRLLKFCEDSKLIKYKIGAINNIALCYYVKGEYEKAIDNYSKSLFILKELIKNDAALATFAKTQLGKTYNNVGNVYLDKGNYPLALDFYFQSLKVVEEMGDERAISNSMGNIGIIYGIQKNYDNSIKYFQKSLAIDSLSGDKNGVANNYSNIGNLYQQKHDYNSSLVYQLKSMALRKELNDRGGVTLSLISLGSLYYQYGIDAEKNVRNAEVINDYYKKALTCYEKARVISKEIGDQNNEAAALTGVGKSKLKLGDIKEGIAHCENSLKISEEIHIDSEIRDVCDCLYEGYTKLKNPAKALIYFERYISLRDTLNSEERIREIAQKQFEFDYNQKSTADSLKTMQQRAMINAELKHEQTRRYYLYGGLLLVIVFAGFIYNRFKISQKQKQIIEKQKEVVEEKQKEILDSIQYAKKIQRTLLAHESFLNSELGDYFILYKPKDIVSGDFFWATRKENRFYFAVCDSTGHGVPGAFMSLLNASLLNEAIVEKNVVSPGEVFNYVRAKLIVNLSSEAQKDGMDGTLICVNKENGEITYAAANNKPVLISEIGLTELSNDKMPIGVGEKKQDFNTYKLEYKKGDLLYLFTDGFADQFGGIKGKKFKQKQLESLLLEISTKSTSEKKEALNAAFENWRGMLDQVDDVTIAGIRL